MENEASIKRVRAMIFGKVYPLYIAKAERKNRTKEEVDEIIYWLTGYSNSSLQNKIQGQATIEVFFDEAPRLNPLRTLITGTVCGVRVEEVKDTIMREVRYLDKLIDELAKGKQMEKILRRSN